MARTCGVLYILTSKCASRHNGLHFFDISTAKSAPELRCFVHFHLEMCFAPQRRALFRHRNFQKWSDAEVFCTFSLGNVLRATVTHTICLCHTPSFTYNFVTHNFVLLLDPPPPSLSFLPSPAPLQHYYVLIIGRSCLVGLSGPLIFIHMAIVTT